MQHTARDHMQPRLLTHARLLQAKIDDLASPQTFLSGGIIKQTDFGMEYTNTVLFLHSDASARNADSLTL